MKLNPYLEFDGNAAEALAYYADLLGGTIVSSMTYAEMPGDFDWVDDSNRERLANGVLVFDDNVLMASDTAGFEPFKGYSGVTLQLDIKDTEEGAALFAKLADGGEVKMAYEATFWASGFGMCTDKYGVPWMIHVE